MPSWETLAISAGLGALRGFAGWYKNWQQGNDKQTFDFWKIAPTIIGYMIGGVLVNLAIDYARLETPAGMDVFAGAYLSEMIETVLKAKPVAKQ